MRPNRSLKQPAAITTAKIIVMLNELISSARAGGMPSAVCSQHVEPDRVEYGQAGKSENNPMSAAALECGVGAFPSCEIFQQTILVPKSGQHHEHQSDQGGSSDSNPPDDVIFALDFCRERSKGQGR